MSIAFSENDAKQSIADLIGSKDVDDIEIFNVVGRRSGIKFRVITGTARDLAEALAETTPVILVGRPTDKSHEHNYPLVLGRQGSSKFHVETGGNEKTVSIRWLQKNGYRDHNDDYHWIVPQQLFRARGASSYNYQTGAIDQPMRPFTRFLGLLKPEVRDIRTVTLFAFFVGLLSLTLPLSVEALVNTIAFQRNVQPLIVLSVIVFMFLALRAGIRVLMTYMVEIIQRRLFVRVIDDVALRLTRVPVAFLKRQHGPELVNRIFDIVNVQKITAKLLLESLMLVLQTIIGLTVLAFYHPFLLGYDIGLIVMMGIVLTIIGRGAIKTSKKESQAKYDTAAWLQEIVRHPTTFKFNGGLAFAINRSDELTAKYVQYRSNHFKILIGQVSFTMLMQAVAATVLLGLGGYLVIEQELTLGQLVAAELIVTVILGSFAKVGQDLESFYDLMASVDKLGKLFDLPGEPADQLQLAPHKGAAGIELVELKFLNGSSQTIDAEIPAQCSAAIIGRSGSGKTKVIETIAGLHTPVDGYVLLNKSRVDLIEAESLQKQLGFLNDLEIFEGTVDENIRLGRSDIDSAAINDIVERMGLHDTLTSLEEGFKTRLSVSGFPLSTSQSIRLVLARALIAKPSLLLIDSILDRLADDEVGEMLRLLDAFKPQTTIVVATGRKAIAQWADLTVDTERDRRSKI